MQARKLDLFRGWAWLVEGFFFLRGHFAPLSAASSTLVLCFMGLLLVPGLGQTVMVLLMPVFEVGMFLICRELAEGQRVGAGLLFEGFRMKLRPLFALGGIRFLGNLTLLWLALLLTGMSVERIEAIQAGKAQMMGGLPADYLRLIGLFLLLRLPLEMACWFAAPCISLRNEPLKKALFFSWIACWRNLPALLVFLLSFGLVCGILPGLVFSLLGKVSDLILIPLFALWVMMSIALFYVAFYRSACDIFGEWPHPLTHEI